MAYAALVSLAQTTDLVLNDNKYSISVDEKEKISSIREYVIFLTLFLEDFPEKLGSRLEGKIRDVANEAEDIIEYFMWKEIHMSWRNAELSRIEFKDQLKKVAQAIGLIAGEMMDDRHGVLPAAVSSSRLASMGKNDMVIGLDDDLMAIKHRLCGESSKLRVVPIVGMGGIGKTTLAKNAYDDLLIMEHFQIRAWLTVSLDYSAEKILSCLVDSMKLFDEEMLGQEEEQIMAEKVYKSLKGKRYLIVMDDVWSTKAWDDVRNIFPDDNNGSRIILTTRLLHVAAYANSCGPPHEMRLMDWNQSWNLLKQKVFTSGESCPPDLEDVGEEIARSCRGLPLAIVLVAGILSSVTKTRASWKEIAKNIISVVDGQLENILSLSYKNLPHHLRPCFLFIGGFPEGYEIRISGLIKLWVAEGFLKDQNGCRSLEEEAEEYLEDLVKRNLVLVNRRKSNGKIKSCSLHDLVRDMCIRKAHEEKFLLHVMDRYVLPESIKNERRLSISNSDLDYLANFGGPTIHTIVCFQLEDDGSDSLTILGNFRLLRVLHVVNSYVRVLPPQLFVLFHLRYLALGSGREIIPSAISNLENLQTLIIKPRKVNLKVNLDSYLPLEIWRMPQLRHLVFRNGYMSPNSADGSTLPLENLQTLSIVTGLACSEKILKMIPNLNKLGLYYCKEQEYELHNLIYLHQLEKLKVTMRGCVSWRGQNPAFPSSLKKLTLVHVGLPWKDLTVVGSLPNLEVLKLKDFACDGDTWQTSDGEFPQLKYLLIEVSDLQHWITESSHFPTLKCLVLHQCLLLRAIPDGIGKISTLELIEVDYMSPYLVYSADQIQEDQQSYGNDTLQVRFIGRSDYQIRDLVAFD